MADPLEKLGLSDAVLKILEDEIVGDGQGCPSQDERFKAASRIVDLVMARFDAGLLE